MTITVDLATEDVRTGTGSPQTWSHGGAASGVKGVVVAIVHGTSSTDHVSAVSYGGSALTEIVRATDTAGEPGAAELWFLGASVPQGTQTVSYTPGATDDDIHAVCITLLGNSDLEVIDSDAINTTITSGPADPSLTLQNTAKTGQTAMAFAALYGGGASPGSFTENANCTSVQDHDLGAFYSEVIRQTTAQTGTADFAIGGTAAADDVAFVAMSVAEKAVNVSANPTTAAATGSVGTVAIETPSAKTSTLDVWLGLYGTPYFYRTTRPSGATSVQANPTSATGTGAVGDLTASGKATADAGTVSATGAAGTADATGKATSDATGVSATGTAETVTVTGLASVTLDGVVGTGGAGDVLAGTLVSVELTGVTGTGAAGDPTVTGYASASLTGVAATGAVGDVTVAEQNVKVSTLEHWLGIGGTPVYYRPTRGGAIAVDVTGVASTGAVGDQTITGAGSVTLDGVAGTGQVGTTAVSSIVSVQVTGTEATGSAGTTDVTGLASVTPASVESTAAAGDITVTTASTSQAAITGVESTGAIGGLTVTGLASVTPNGVSTTGEIGTLAGNAGTLAILPSANATGAVGDLAAVNDHVQSVAGIESACAAGTLTASGITTVTVTGVSATGQVGTADSTGTASATITGVQSSGIAATPNVSSEQYVLADLTGVEAIPAIGTADASPGIPGAIYVTGVTATGSAGTARQMNTNRPRFRITAYSQQRQRITGYINGRRARVA